VALDLRHLLVHAQRAERDPLVQLDVPPDPAGLADDDACAVVDAEAVSDLGPRVDVDPRPGVGPFREHPGQDRHLAAMEVVGDPVDRDGQEARVAPDDFGVVRGRRVAGVDGVRVLQEHVPEPGQAVVQLRDQRLGLRREAFGKGGQEVQQPVPVRAPAVLELLELGRS
jgi:hypothetical protein